MIRLAQKIIVEGFDDWVPLYDVDGMARVLDGDAHIDLRRETVMEAIGELVNGGLIELGEVSVDRGFVAFDEPTPASLLRLWRLFGNGDSMRWGFELWINNTTAGDEAAALLIKRASAPDD
jgi:hypothetical protein